jgi:hypothetical protein
MSSIVVSMRVSDVTAAFRFGGILFSRRPQRLEKLLFFGLPCGGERKKVARLIRTAPRPRERRSTKNQKKTCLGPRKIPPDGFTGWLGGCKRILFQLPLFGVLGVLIHAASSSGARQYWSLPMSPTR